MNLLPRYSAGLFLALAFVVSAQSQDPVKEAPPPKEVEGNPLDVKGLMKSLRAHYAGFSDLRLKIEQTCVIDKKVSRTTTQLFWKSGKMRSESTCIEADSTQVKTIVVNDASRAWRWRSSPRSEHCELKTRSEKNYLFEADLVILGLLAGETKRFETDDTRALEVEVDGESCRRIETSYGLAGGKKLTIRCDFDKELRPIRARVTIDEEKEAQGRPVRVQSYDLRSVYRDFKKDSGLDDKLFEFIPPKDSKKVDFLADMEPPRDDDSKGPNEEPEKED